MRVQQPTKCHFLYFFSRKLISWRVRSPFCRTILPTYWKRRKGLSSYWQHTSRSARSPQNWTQTFLRPACPPPSLPLSLPASQPSPRPQTQSSPAPALSPPPPRWQTARSRWQIWRPLSSRSPWTFWQRPSWRRRARSPRSTCPAPSFPTRTGSPFTRQPAAMTLSPCAHLWWPAPQLAPPTRHLSPSPSPRLRPSPPVASHTGEEAAATIIPLTPSAHQPCWPFRDSCKNKLSSKKHIFLNMWQMCRLQGYGADLYQKADYLWFSFLPLPITTCLLHQCSKL